MCQFFLIPSLHSLITVVYGGVLAAIICVPTACARRPRGALGDLTALLLRCRCEPTAFTRRSFRSPLERRATTRTLCMHKVRAVAWRPRRPHGIQWRCHGDATTILRRSRRSHCAHLGVLSFSCTPGSRRESFLHVVRTPSWCVTPRWRPHGKIVPTVVSTDLPAACIINTSMYFQNQNWPWRRIWRSFCWKRGV